jgi:hypothetical protein
MPVDVDSVAAFCNENPHAGLFAALLAFTMPAYKRSLALISREFGITKFAPWDILYAQQKLSKEIDSIYSQCASVILTKPAEAIRTLLMGLGFSNENEATRLGPSSALPGITIIFERDELKSSFGNTHDFSILFPESGAALCKINSSRDSYTDVKMLFHEVGHALHFVNMRPKYRQLRELVSKLLCEGIARVFEHFAVDGYFLELTFGRMVELKRLIMLIYAREIYTFRECLVLSIMEMLSYVKEVPPYEIPDGFLRHTLFPDVDAQGLGQGFFIHRYARKFVHYDFSAFDIVHHYLIQGHISERARAFNHGRLFAAGFAEFARPLFRASASGKWYEVLKEATFGEIDFSLTVQMQERGIEGLS